MGSATIGFHKPIFGNCWQRGHVRDTSPHHLSNGFTNTFFNAFFILQIDWWMHSKLRRRRTIRQMDILIHFHSSNGYTNTFLIIKLLDWRMHFYSSNQLTNALNLCFPAIFAIMYYLRPIVLIYRLGSATIGFHKPIFGNCWQRGHVRDTSLWLVCLFCCHEYFVASYKFATNTFLFIKLLDWRMHFYSSNQLTNALNHT